MERRSTPTVSLLRQGRLDEMRMRKFELETKAGNLRLNGGDTRQEISHHWAVPRGGTEEVVAGACATCPGCQPPPAAL